MEVKFKIEKDIINTIIDKMAEIESNDLRIKQLVCNSKDIDKIIKERNQYKKEMNKRMKELKKQRYEKEEELIKNGKLKKHSTSLSDEEMDNICMKEISDKNHIFGMEIIISDNNINESEVILVSE